MNLLDALFRPPQFEDEEKTRKAFLLHVILWVLIVVALLYFLYSLLASRPIHSRLLSQISFALSANILLLILTKHGFVRLAAILQIVALWGFFTVTAWTAAGVHHEAYQIGYACVIAVAGVILGLRGALITAALSILSGGMMMIAANTGLMSFKPPDSALVIWVVSAILFPVLAVIQYLSDRLLRTALSRSQISEASYRLLANNIKDHLWLMDLNFRTTYMSPSAEKARGYTFEEFAGLPLEKRLTPPSIEKAMAFYKQEIDKVLADPNYYPEEPLEIEVYCKDGSTLWLETTYSAIRDKKGRPTSILGVGRDITERKWVEEQSRSNEERFRLLAENARDTIWTMDMNLQYTYMSPYVKQILDYTPEEYVKLPLSDVLAPESLQRCLQCLDEELMIEKRPDKNPLRSRTLELEHIARDGRMVPVEMKLTFIRDREGVATGILGYTRDITDRRRAEEELRKSEDKYRTLIETTNTGFVIIDHEGRVLDANPEYVRLTGHRELKEIKGRSVIEWTAEHDKDRNMEAVRECFDKGSIKNMEISYVNSHGRVTPIELNATCLTVDGKIQTITLCRDITDRRRADEEKHALEERLQRAEKMEALGTLAGGVAHDLNNVLGVIVGYAELLAIDSDPSSRHGQRLSKIMNASEKASAIVQDLLTLARRGVPGRKVLNLNQIILDYQSSLEYEKLISYHGAVRIQSELDADLLNISGSHVHLGKALSNLISNAAEAMPGGGTLTVRTFNQYLDKPIHGYDTVREGDYVVLAVTDTGEGIPAADLQRIFEPFYTKKVMGRSGTGLGLAVVWGTVKDHQAYINVQSEEGKGSTFTLYFPVTRDELSQEPAAISAAAYTGRGETILVVDDVQEQRELATEILKKLNYQVFSAAGGREAVAHVREKPVDLMILDMIMEPDMDGLDTYRSVLKIRPKQKAIIVSGFSETDRVSKAQSLGAGAYLRKPYVMEKLGLAVRRELDR